MNYTEHKITLDVNKTVSQVSIRVKKGDTARRLLISLMASGYPYHITEECYAVIAAKKPDGYVIFNNCSIENSVIGYDFTGQTVAAVGLMNCEVIIYGARGVQLSSASFDIIVEESNYRTVESSSEATAISTLMEEIKKLYALGLRAPAIIADAEGKVISLTDTADEVLQGLRIFGKSTQAAVPTPDNPVEIVNIGASGSIKTKMLGKNIVSGLEYSGTSKDYGTLVKSSDTMAVKKGQVYTISITLTAAAATKAYWNGNAGIFADSEQIDVSAGTNRYRKTFTAAADGDMGISRILLSKASTGDGVAITPSNCQIELGTVATAYANTEQIAVIATPGGIPGIPVDSGGNYMDSNGKQWICDEVDLGRGVYVQRIGKAILKDNSTSRITYSTNYGEAVRFDVKGLPAAAKAGAIFCTHLPVGVIGTSGAEICNTHGTSGFPIVQILASRLESADVNGFVKFLSNNPMTIYYLLTEPVETVLTAENIAAFANMRSYKGNTSIYNDVGAYMAAEYVADTKTYVDRSGGSGSAVRIGSVNLLAANWKGAAAPYSQVVSIAGVTENSQVDLTPSVEQLAVFYNKSLAFVTENEGGVVTVYAIGDKPKNDYTIQVTITEVNV